MLVTWWSGGILLQAAGTGEASWAGALLPFVLMFAIFYFLLIRPQQKQQRKRQEMLNSVKRGDRIVTVGGIHGEVTGVKDDVLTLRIADKVEIKINKAGVGYIKGQDSA